MTITPVELHHVRLGRGLLGYRRSAVDRLLAETEQSFEEVWRQRAELADRVEELESDLARHTDLEALLRTTLVSAETAAHEHKDHARREAEIVVEVAHAEARSVTMAAAAERERLRAEARKVRALLEAALDAVEDAGAEEANGGSEREAA
jgi:cell division initiation protein